jgi:long-chain fatty acid transport protein
LAISEAKKMSAVFGGKRLLPFVGALLAYLVLAPSYARSQTYGIELQNTLMPVSGAMGGASIAMPQDFLSAINGNPGALADFEGTHFTFGGAWAEATYNVEQLATLPLIGVTPFDAKSGTPGAMCGNIGVSQEISLNGMPAVFGLALITNAGVGVDFRGVPESDGTSVEYVALDLDSTLAVPLTEKLSAGTTFTLGNSFIDGPFTDLGGMVPAYGIRGTFGVNYALYPETKIGAYWQSKKHFRFDDAVVFSGGNTFDIPFDHPETMGIGIADKSFMGGDLLIATDVLFKRYGDADFLQAVYEDQWVFQTGMQYTVGPKVKLRCGYSYNTDPMSDAAFTSIGGVPIPDGFPGLRYIQGQFAAICQHHVTGGIGIANVLPGIDMDSLAGGMFETEEQFASTIASVESYWVGSYFTWRFGGAKEVSR